MKFNIFKKKVNNDANVIKNHEGAKAYKMSPELELYTGVVTAALNENFYEKSGERLNRLHDLMLKTDPEFIAKLALYARNDMYMRSVPLVLAVELAKIAGGTSMVSKTVKGVVKRADEITELLAFYQLSNNRNNTKKLNKLSKQVQKGLADAFNSFDEYQFAKYDRAGEVKLRDALFLVHPKAKDENQQVIFNKIANKALETPYTWETELSALGQVKFYNAKEKEKAFAHKWEELIFSGKLGYMAMLRNLRNMMDANISYNAMRIVCDKLSDAKAVANAKQFPFRFLAAYREVKEMKSDYTSMVLNALENAAVASAQNIKGFDEKTKILIACDVSGSMQQPISAKSKVLMYDIGLMLGMLLQSKCTRVVSGMFGDTWKVVNMPNRGILANVNEFYRREGEVGYATNGYLVIEDLIKRNVIMDKVMMFTDMQMWNNKGNNAHLETSWLQYKKIAPNAKLYLFDLTGYGKAPINYQRNDVCLIAGWSDKIFDVLNAIEEGSDAVKKIKAISL